MSVFLNKLHYYNEKWSISIPPNLSCVKFCVLAVSLTCLFGTTCEVCARYQAFCRQVGTQIHSVTPSSAHCTHHLRRTWFLAFIFSSLNKPNTLHVPLLPWVLIWFFYFVLFIWFFKKMPKPQAQRRQESKGWEECTKKGRCREWREKLRSKEEGEKGGGSKQWEVEGRRLPLTPSWVLGEPGPGLRLHPGSQLPGLPAGYSPQVKQVPSDQKWASGGLF